MANTSLTSVTIYRPKFLTSVMVLSYILIILFIALNDFFGTLLHLPSIPKFQMFATLFLTIFLEALPFVLLGIIISSFVEIYFSKELLHKYTPKNKLAGSFLGA